MDMLAQPLPFEIAVAGDGHRVASNGEATLSVMEPEAKLWKRRAQKGLALKPPAEIVIPLLNQLAGELLASPHMPAHEVAERVRAIAGQAQPVPPRNVEWAVAELDGVRCYFDGRAAILTRLDLAP